MDTDLSSKFRFSSKNRSALSRYALALLAVAVATFAHWLLTLDNVHTYSPFIIFYPAVVFAAWYGGVGPGLVAASLSSLLGTFLFTSRPNTFQNLEVGDFLQLILFVFVSLTICLLIGNLYQSLSENSEKTREVITSRGRIKNILESIQGCFFSLDEQDRLIHINEDCRHYLSKLPEKYYVKNKGEN
jgi:K+-sensing histidine kinase KdpD